jgi:hypothetical protein
MDKPGTEAHQHKEPDSGRGILRFMGFVLLIEVIALILGFAFFLIANGLIWGIMRLAVVWQPSQRVFRRVVLGYSESGTATSLNALSIASLFILIVLRASLIGLGTWLLVSNGFWRQNIIWIATH